MSQANEKTWIGRFLAPRFVAKKTTGWPWQGHATAAGSDAVCSIYIKPSQDRIEAVGFRVYGPPVCVAAADYLCELVSKTTQQQLADMNIRQIEQALTLTTTERYSAMLALDALDKALQ